ncbi:MAG TPA: CHAT domain-containing tetratricopeptide repeat protein [Opitutaceae bacterium]|nr:CHAT domain-containing tetratricopeptide repeat protein [Opitutaceae bacterium]
MSLAPIVLQYARTWLCIAVLLAIPCPTWGGSGPGDGPADDRARLLAESREASNSGRIDQALAGFTALEKLDRVGVAAAATADAVSLTEARARLAQTLGYLATVRARRGEWAESLAACREYVALEETAHGNGSFAHRFALGVLARTARDAGRLDEAERAGRRVLELTEAGLGRDATEVATALDDLATILERRKQPDEAEKALRRGLAIREAKLGPESTGVADALLELARLLNRSEQFPEAAQALRRCVTIREARLGPDHVHLAVALYELGITETSAGRPGAALSALRRSLAINRAQPQPDRVGIGLTLFRIGLAHLALGQDSQVEQPLKEAVSILEKEFGPNHVELAPVLNALAVAILRTTTGDWRDQEVKEYLDRAVAIWETHYGPDSLDAASIRINLAAFDQRAKRYPEARAGFQKALSAFRNRGGPDHPKVVSCLEKLAQVEEDMGHAGEAVARYAEAMTILKKERHPDLARIVGIAESAGLLSARAGRWEDAGAHFDLVRRSVFRRVADLLPDLPLVEQTKFLGREDGWSFHRALSLAVARPGDGAIAGLTAGWVLNGKLAWQEALGGRLRDARESTNPQTTALVRQLTAVRSRLAALAGGGFRHDEPDEVRSAKGPADVSKSSKRKKIAPGVYEHTSESVPEAIEEAERRKRASAEADKIDRLVDLERELSSRLALALGEGKRSASWISPDAVRAAVPRDSVLVEIVDLDAWDFGAGQWTNYPKGRHFVAWVFPPAGRGDVRVVDLGDGWALGKAVEDFRAGIDATDQDVFADGEAAVEAKAKAALGTIGRQVLDPLLPHVGGYERWLICPDTSLWLVPWAALPLPDGRYAVEAHRIDLLSTGRDVARAAPAVDPDRGGAFVLADPDFGPGGQFLPLPGTRVEANALVERLGKITRPPHRVVTGKDASETTLGSLAGAPRLLVASTHGYVLPMPPEPLSLASREYVPARKKRVFVDNGPGLPSLQTNPMVRCGLALAGANRRPDGRVGDGPGDAVDDGLLTGLEVLSLDLRGTELVVLAACQTALGDVRQGIGLGVLQDGEGTAGLRQAFQLAGARGVIATLWKVPDAESSRLMGAFWDEFAAGRPAGDALRRAQLDVIRSRRAGGEKAAHPYYWAGFTFTGAP